MTTFTRANTDAQAGSRTTVTTYHHHDALGSVIALTDGTGAVIERYKYDVFGQPTFLAPDGVTVRAESSYGNKFLFTGREWLPLSGGYHLVINYGSSSPPTWQPLPGGNQVGLYDYRNRAYTALLGRFMQTDPIRFDAGDANLYRYVGNGPLSGTDPFGLKEKDTLENAKSTIKVCDKNGCDMFKVKSLLDLATLMSYIRTLPQGTYTAITIAGHGSTVGSTVLTEQEMKRLASLLDAILTKDAKVYLNGCETTSDAEWLSTMLPGRTISGNENGAGYLGGVTTIRDPRHPFTPKNEKSFKDGKEVPRNLP